MAVKDHEHTWRDGLGRISVLRERGRNFWGPRLELVALVDAVCKGCDAGRKSDGTVFDLDDYQITNGVIVIPD